MAARRQIRRRVRRARPMVRRAPSSSAANVRMDAKQSMSGQGGLMIGGVHDPAEKAADRMADRVMRMPASQPIVHRKCEGCAGEEKKVQRLAEEPDKEEMVQTKAAPKSAPVAPGAGAVAASPGAARAIRSMGGGKPLARTERAFFEPRFGADLSSVRVHDGPTADTATRAVSARAFTLGKDVAFASGEYRPGTETGRHLMAHELAHVMQQGHDGLSLQRDLARPPRGVADPIQLLTAQQIQDAIAFDQARFSDPYSIRVIRDVIGLDPLPAVVDRALVNEIAAWQAERRMTQDGKIGHITTRTLFLELVAEAELRDAILLVMDSYSLPSSLQLHDLRVGIGPNCCGPAGGLDAVTFGGPHCPPVGGPVRICVCRTSIPRGIGGYNHFVRIVGHELIHVPQCAGGTGNADVDEFEGFFWEACGRGRAPQLAPAVRVNHANIALGHFNLIPVALQTPLRVARRARLQALVAAGGVGAC